MADTMTITGARRRAVLLTMRGVMWMSGPDSALKGSALKDPAPKDSTPKRPRSDMASTRFMYRRDDKMVKTFFATNVYKSAALVDLIYLFILEHGPDADVSQLLRERIVMLEGGTVSTEDTVDAMPAAEATNESSNNRSIDASGDTPSEDKQPTPKKQSGFDISDML